MEHENTRAVRIEVECSFGAGARPEPSRLHLGRAVYDVVQVVDRWHQGPRKASHPVRAYFKVRTYGDSLFLISRDEASNTWFLVKAFGPEIPVL